MRIELIEEIKTFPSEVIIYRHYNEFLYFQQKQRNVILWFDYVALS